MAFKMKEKLKHYTAVASGEKATKKDSKFSKKEQQAYARGQRDARNEANAVYASQHATPAQKEAFKKKQAKRKAKYYASKAE